MNRLLTSTLALGLLLLLIPGGAWGASSNCVIHSPENKTYATDTGINFSIRCYPELVNFSKKNQSIPNVTVALINGTLSRVINLSAASPANVSAQNTSGYLALRNGSSNATFFYANTTSPTLLNQLSVLFTVDTVYPKTVLLLSPFNATYPSGIINISCLTNNASTWTYTLDNQANTTVSSTAINVTVITSAIADGPHNLTCTATKTANGLSNTSVRTYFTVNSSAPIIQWRDADTLNAVSFINENRSSNVTVTSPWNISDIIIDFPNTYGLGIAANDTNVLFTQSLNGYTTNIDRTANIIHLFNTSATLMPYVNNDTSFIFNIFKNSTQTPLTDGDVNVVFAWVINDSKFLTSVAVGNTTVTVRVRNLSNGPFLMNASCGGTSEVRAVNKSTVTLPNRSACNLTFAAPLLTTGNFSDITNTTAYGWSCSYFCLASNRTVNSTATRWLLIEVRVPPNSTFAVLQPSPQVSVKTYYGPLGVMAGAGLAIYIYLRRKRQRGQARVGN